MAKAAAEVVAEDDVGFGRGRGDAASFWERGLWRRGKPVGTGDCDDSLFGAFLVERASERRIDLRGMMTVEAGSEGGSALHGGFGQ